MAYYTGPQRQRTTQYAFSLIFKTAYTIRFGAVFVASDPESTMRDVLRIDAVGVVRQTGTRDPGWHGSIFCHPSDSRCSVAFGRNADHSQQDMFGSAHDPNLQTSPELDVQGTGLLQLCGHYCRVSVTHCLEHTFYHHVYHFCQWHQNLMIQNKLVSHLNGNCEL